MTPSMPFGKGFQWREMRRVLYLREDCVFTVQEYDVRFYDIIVTPSAFTSYNRYLCAHRCCICARLADYLIQNLKVLIA